MINNKRKGIIGLAITLGLGVAISAAALFTGSAINNEKSKKDNATNTADITCTVPDLQRAYENYTESYIRYQNALQKGSRYLDIYKAAFEKAKHDLEIAILSNTMGTSQMDLRNILKK